MGKQKQRKLISKAIFAVTLGSFYSVCSAVDLIDVQGRELDGNRAQMLLRFNGPVPEPKHFSLESPAKYIFDFIDVGEKLDKIDQDKQVSYGVLNRFQVASIPGRTRVVIDADSLVAYKMFKKGDSIAISFDSADKKNVSYSKNSIRSVDFRRGDKDDGRIILDIGDNKPNIDLKEEDGKLIVDFMGMSIPDKLLRDYDVRDFGTPIERMTFKRMGNNVRMKVGVSGNNENISYQLDNEYTLEVRPKSSNSDSSLGSNNTQQFKYNGERVSLSVVDADTKSLIEKLSQFTGMNVIISDNIAGKTTLSLKDVPWDQAFDLILNTNGLAKREMGNILQVAPAEMIQAREEIQLQNEKSQLQLEPLYSEFIKINYAEASTLADLVKNEGSSLLTERGQVSVDERTNTILVRETESQLNEIKKMIQILDIPVKQVMIEAQIVETTDNHGGVFAATVNGALTARFGKHPFGLSNTGEKALNLADGTTSTKDSRGTFFDGTTNIGLPLSSQSTGGFGFSLARLPGGTILDLELKALEAESKASVSSRPKLLTQDNQKAVIESGQEFPVTVTSQDGATPTTTYKEAVLKLEVTPKITPDNKISMEMDIHNDKKTSTNSDSVDTTKLKTHALVDNGETVVIGGIYKLNSTRNLAKVPFLGDLPFIGMMFRDTSRADLKTEIIIFITPRIVNNRIG